MLESIEISNIMQLNAAINEFNNSTLNSDKYESYYKCEIESNGIIQIRFFAKIKIKYGMASHADVCLCEFKNRLWYYIKEGHVSSSFVLQEVIDKVNKAFAKSQRRLKRKQK